MGLAKTLEYLSVEDYLAGERDSPTRHEYVDGQVYAMAGASDRHNRIAINFTNRLDDHLRDGPCEVFVAPYYRRQPRLIVEVSSPGVEPPGTERIDRSEKLLAYKRVKSLKEYEVISKVEKVANLGVKSGIPS
jgi:Uma2 family endonuclease